MLKSVVQLLCLLGAVASPAWGTTTGHWWIPAANFTCNSGTYCTKSTYLAEFASGKPEPIIKFTEPGSFVSARAPIFFPPSHITTDVNFSIVVHDLQFTSGAKYCWGFGIGISPPQGGWGTQNEALPTKGWSTHSPGLYVGDNDSLAIQVAPAKDYSTGVNCSTESQSCWGAPGFLYIYRQNRTATECSTSTADPSGFLGIDLYWTIP